MAASNSESVQETMNVNSENLQPSDGGGSTGRKRDVNEGRNDDSTLLIKKSRETSEVWNYFVKFTEDGRTRAKCKECGTNYAVGSNSHGTTNLKRHLNVCPKRNTDARQLHLSHDIKLRAKKIKPEIYREKMAIAIIKHNYPFSIVEHEGLRDVLTYLNDDVKLYTRNTVKVDCWKLYNKEKDKLQSILSKVPGIISLTSDCWTSCTTESYICLTAHYVDENWKLHAKILSMRHFPPPHTGALMAKMVFDLLREWGIEGKIFSLTLDNASNCDKMEEVLREQMDRQNLLLCNGSFFHVRCSAHILNIIVQQGLKATGGALNKIRESVKYFKGSEGRLLKFKELCKQNDISTSAGLRIDVPTCWNSTFLMLERALHYRRVFLLYGGYDVGYTLCPDHDEWTRAEKICMLLKPFAEITTLFSGSKYPTANLYFKSIWKIQLRLIEESNSDDMVVRGIVESMKEKFQKYWDSYSIILAIAVVLDPRYKLSLVEFCYRKVDCFTCEEKVNVVKEKIKMLFQEYAKHVSSQTTTTSVTNSFTCGDLIEPELYGYEDYDNEFNNSKSELDLYLEERKHKQVDMDILEYWESNSARYPIISVMARDVMSIPITTVASESTFSIGGKVLTSLRSSLSPENAECLICTRNWLHGFEVNGDDREDDDVLVIPIERQVLVTSSRSSRESANITEI